MSVSIVIPVHDRIEHLRKLIYYFDKWQKQDDVEIIISDDNSRDDFALFVEEAQKTTEIPIKYTSYKYFNKHHLFRLSKARNEGCRLAEKDFLLIIDGDRILAPNYVSDCLEKYKAIGRDCVLGGRTIYLKTQPGDIGEDVDIEFFNDVEKVESHDRALPLFRPYAINDITDHFWASLYGGGVFIKRSTFESFGGYDTEYEGWGSEDNDFALMVRRSGARVLLDWDLVMYHLNHECYHGEYDLDYFQKSHGKQPFDFTMANRERYSSKLTPEEIKEARL